jgi:glycosyltransferase involved in cell wall biosynthesis
LTRGHRLDLALWSPLQAQGIRGADGGALATADAGRVVHDTNVVRHRQGPELAALHALVTAHTLLVVHHRPEVGMGDRVIFLSDIPERDLPLLYNGAQVFVFPSLYEGFGLPVLEAMACGTPVVCSNTSSLPEIVGDAAITLDPEDTGAWVMALDSVLENEELRAELRTKGLEQAAKFTWQETARETLEVYRRVLSR